MLIRGTRFMTQKTFLPTPKSLDIIIIIIYLAKMVAKLNNHLATTNNLTHNLLQ